MKFKPLSLTDSLDESKFKGYLGTENIHEGIHHLMMCHEDGRYIWYLCQVDKHLKVKAFTWEEAQELYNAIVKELEK